MSDKVEKQQQQSDDMKVRITLSSPSVKHVEKVASDVISNAKKLDIEPCGPVRLPTKVLKVTTRKTPNGEGSKTWDTYEMRIHKRIIVVESQPAKITKVARMATNNKVTMSLTVAN